MGRFTDLFLEFAPITFLYSLASQWFWAMPWLSRWLLLFLLTTTVQERLLRAPLVDTFATSAFRYSVLSDSKALLPLLIATAAIATLKVRLDFLPNRILFSASLAAFMLFVVAPLENSAYARLLDHFAYLSHPGLYEFPYPWQLNLPAYVLCIEPTVSAVLIYSLVNQRLSPRPNLNLFQFALLLALSATLSPVHFSTHL